jgi:hypothetical protein
MTDYDGLNNLLQATDSLAAGTRPYISSTEFDTNMEIPTNYIGSANIRNFNFSQGQGGTLALGGTLNGDGLLLVNNNSGTPVVTLDNTGITVTNGSITINNSSGSPIVDSLGIVGVNNFIDVAVAVPTGTVTGTSWVDVAGGTLVPIIVSRTTPIFYTFTSYGLQSNVWNDSGKVIVGVFEGTTPILYNYLSGNDINGTTLFGQDIYSGYFSQITAGTHIYNVKVRNDTATSTAIVSSYLNVTKYGT